MLLIPLYYMVNISTPVPLALISTNISPNMHHIFNHYPHHLIIRLNHFWTSVVTTVYFFSLCSSINVRVGIDPAPNIISTTSDYVLINNYLSCESVDSILLLIKVNTMISSQRIMCSLMLTISHLS